MGNSNPLLACTVIKPNGVNAFDSSRQLAQGSFVAEDLKAANPIKQRFLWITIWGKVIFDGELEKLMHGKTPLLGSGIVIRKEPAQKGAAIEE